MSAKFFDHSGYCLIGKNTKGKHHSEISASFCEWACNEIQGFKEQYTIAKTKPKSPQIKPTGRTYLIKRKRNNG